MDKVQERGQGPLTLAPSLRGLASKSKSKIKSKKMGPILNSIAVHPSPLPEDAKKDGHGFTVG
jgi:hypothetical protein